MDGKEDPLKTGFSIFQFFGVRILIHQLLPYFVSLQHLLYDP